MKCLITDKELKGLKHLQEKLEERQISQEQAALSLKYILEDIEAKELDVKYESPVVTPDGTNEKQRVIVASYAGHTRPGLQASEGRPFGSACGVQGRQRN